MSCESTCGWKLYEIKIDLDKADIDVDPKADPAPAAKTKPAMADAKKELDAGKDSINDSPNKLQFPLANPKCTPPADCECKKLGLPIWEDNFDAGWTLTVPLGKGWIAKCPAEVKQGIQNGVCSNKKKGISPKG